MYRPITRTSLFLSFLLTIPFSQLKNQAAVHATFPAAANGVPSTVNRESSITVTNRLKVRHPLIINEDSSRVDHIIELY